MDLQNFIIKMTNEAVLLVIFMSLPAIIASLVVGLSVALFSATTQIQEQTLSFAPKMIIVYITLAVCSGWIGSLIIRFATECMTSFVSLGL